uniref:Acyl-CoA:lysophosphatidylglycerol acyltransferase 1-like n=1 Tax=Diabrotica virgifera virgifera TaxID=50390 RepID=A0A6P7GB05_DIAVI
MNYICTNDSNLNSQLSSELQILPVIQEEVTENDGFKLVSYKKRIQNRRPSPKKGINTDNLLKVVAPTPIKSWVFISGFTPETEATDVFNFLKKYELDQDCVFVELGDDIAPCLNDRTLVIANHQSTADVPLLFSCFNPRKQVLPNIMWIMDSVFKYTNFGVVSVLHKDFFIMSGKSKRDKSLQEFAQHLLDFYIPLKRKWLVLFPEGGFLRKRKAVSQRYCEKMNLPRFENVTLPRVGAMQVIMETLSKKSAMNNNSNSVNNDKSETPLIEWFLDITIAYPKGWPIDLSHIVFGNREPCETIMFYRLYPQKDVPQDTETLTSWLFDRWVEKEKMLENYYRTGIFTCEFSKKSIGPKRLVQQDYLRFAIVHIFFIASTYLHTMMLVTVYNYCNYLVY